MRETRRNSVHITHHHGVFVPHAVPVAVLAHVKVGADRAAHAGARLYLHVAEVAGGGEGRRLGVVQVVQHHHAAVLGAPQGVKLRQCKDNRTSTLVSRETW